MSTFPAVLVTGSRQAGKTTLLRTEHGSTHGFISLERPEIRARAHADPVGFLREHSPPVILDEIQYVPELLSYIKDSIDSDRRPGRWLLTGSQSFVLLESARQTLAGRVAVLELDPLGVMEVARRTDPWISVDDALSALAGSSSPRDLPATALNRWLLRGGYPELCLNPRVDRKLWLSSYIQTYLERDVRDLLAVGDLDAFSRFISLVAIRVGSNLNITALGRDAGISTPTAKRWLSVLRRSQVIWLLRPYHRNLGKRIVKSPKVYFMDPGLLTFLLGIHDPEAALHGPVFGALFESATIAEWIKLFRQNGEPPPIYFWSTGRGLEVDLVIERNQRLYGMEIKGTATPRVRDIESLVQWKRLARNHTEVALLCNVDAPAHIAHGVRALPWYPYGTGNSSGNA